MDNMKPLIDILANGSTLTIATMLVLGVAFIAWKLSVFKQSSKDKLAESVTCANEDIVANLRNSYDSQFSLMMTRIAAMDATILELRDLGHRLQIKATRQQVLLIQFKGLCADKAIPLPEYMAEELKQLLE